METNIKNNLRILTVFAILAVGFSYLLTANGHPSIPNEVDLPNGVAVEGDSSPYETVEDKIRAAFPEDPDTAVAIAKAESMLNPVVIGDKHLGWDDGRNGMSCGIFQIRVFPKRPDCEKLLDEDFNIDYARELYESSGWSPWSTYKSGGYKKFLG